MSLIQKSQRNVKKIRIHDGRFVELDCSGSTLISSDHADYNFDFSWIAEEIDWHRSVRQSVIDLLSTHSVDYAYNCGNDFKLFAERLVDRLGELPAVLELKHLADYPEHRPISTWPFVSAIISRCIASQYLGVDHELKAFLEQPEKWEQKGSGSYFALVANDPRRGALTEQELRSVYFALNKAYADGQLQTSQWALCYFLIATGVRPIQIARMKVRDVVPTNGPEGVEYTLTITIAKTREAIKKTRWKRKCPTQLAEVLTEYLSIPSMRNASPDDPLFADQSAKVTSELQTTFRRLETYSERLDEPVPLFPYRFRYTLGTRAIALGARDEEVARLLTHTSLHCVRYYRAAMPSLQAPIADAIGAEMSIFAKAFKGRLIDDLAEATRSGDESALITAYEHLHGDDLGACGTSVRCYQDAPRSCLTCPKFEPFREAPWRQLRDVLVIDRDAEKSERIKMITDEQIAAVDQIIALTQPTAGD